VAKRDLGEGEDESEALARLVSEGVRPKGTGDRLRLMAAKLLGQAPLGVDARSRTVRKVLGGGGELSDLLEAGLLGGVSAPGGALLLVFGLIGWSPVLVACGAAGLAVGVHFLRRARQAWRNLRAITPV